MMNNATNDQRPGLAIIANTLPPYRVNLHREVARGIPELKLHTLITHGAAEFDWKVDAPESIHVSYFGASGDSPLASPFRSPLAEYRKGGRIIRYLREHSIRAVICNGYRYASLMRVMRDCPSFGIPVYYRNDSNIRCERDLAPWKQTTKRLIYHWIMKRTNGIMSMGEYGDQFFLKYGASRNRMYRVPCMPDYDYFAGCDATRLQEFQRRFGLRPERRYLLYSGRLVPKKRVDLLIQAFEEISTDRPDWSLLIVGDGNSREALRQQAVRIPIEKIVWTGFLDVPECVTAYHSADALVLPSDREPWALVVQEAMAAGLPVIASDAVGAARELVVDHENGRVFPAGDGERLAQALLDVTNNSTYERYKRQTKLLFAKWREESNPVREIRRALTDCGVLPVESDAHRLTRPNSQVVVNSA